MRAARKYHLRKYDLGKTGLSPNLNTQLRTALLTCAPFDNVNQLKSIFIDSRLVEWKNKLPTKANSEFELVELIINFLYHQNNGAGENALVLLLHVLSERHGLDDSCNKRLGSLADELAKGINSLGIDGEEVGIGMIIPLGYTIPNLILVAIIAAVAVIVAIMQFMPRVGNGNGAEGGPAQGDLSSSIAIVDLEESAILTLTPMSTPSATATPTLEHTPTLPPPTATPSAFIMPTWTVTPTATSTLTPSAIVSSANPTIGFRTGPGPCFDLIGELRAGTEVILLARNDVQSIWVYGRALINNKEEAGWAASYLLDFELTPEALPTAENIPIESPTCTPTSLPNATIAIDITLPPVTVASQTTQPTRTPRPETPVVTEVSTSPPSTIPPPLPSPLPTSQD